jgi:hypothetical protein
MNLQEYKEHRQKLIDDPKYAADWKRKQEEDLRRYWQLLKPFINEEDVPNLPKMDKFYINRLIELGAIPKKDLKDGFWYYGNYRNAKLGQWDAKNKVFKHWRWKFGWLEDTCNHFEDDNGFALFVPLREANNKEVLEVKKIENDMRK